MFVLGIGQSKSQVISENFKRKVTLGVDFYNDFWFNKPLGMKTRNVNQGFNVFMQYNFYLNDEGTIVFGVGPGIGNHNLYSNMKLDNIKGDSIKFVPIIGDYRRSKVNVVYVYIPMDVKFRFKHNFKMSFGFNFGWEVDSKQKFVRNNKETSESKIVMKEKKIDHLDKFTYGPTLRGGWNFISVYVFYQINGIFEKGVGTDNLNYLSVGVSLKPF